MQKINDDNREDIIDAYCNRVVEGMGTKELVQFVYDVLYDSKSEYTDEQLETEIMDYYPDLIEDE